VQADGLNQLRQPGGKNRGDAGDPWPGSSGAVTFGPETSPPALDNSGATAGFVLDSIEQVAPMGALHFRVTPFPPGQVLLTLDGARDALFGRGGLGSAQLTKLDSLGNRNGRYDTGDFLAFWEMQLMAVRTGRQVTP
jgi:hypothetical protein